MPLKGDFGGQHKHGKALRSISVERGYDPREFALLPFGSAGGLHAVDLATALRIPRVIAPTAAVLSQSGRDRRRGEIWAAR